MPTKVDLNRKVFQAFPLNSFMDLRQGGNAIVPKESVTVGEILNESLPILKDMARDYLFLEGKSVNYRDLIGFLAYVKENVTS